LYKKPQASVRLCKHEIYMSITTLRYILLSPSKKFSTTFFRILPQNLTFYLKNSDDLFSSLPYFKNCPSSLFLNSTFSPQKFLDDLFYDFTPKLYILSLKNSDDLFLVIDLLYHFLPFPVLQMMNPISHCLHTIHPLTLCIHTRMLFFRFLHLALLCSRNSE